MKPFKLTVIILGAVGFAILLTACWDRQEINDIAFILGTAYDKKNNEYMVTIQFPLPSQLGGANGGGGGTSGSKTWYIDSVLAPTISEAISKQQQSLSRRSYSAHRRVLLIGEAMARSGISPIMDVVSRIPEHRLTAYLVVTEGEARDVLNSNVPIEIVPAEMVRELTVQSMKQPRTIKHVVNSLLSDGIDTAVPLYAPANTKTGDKGKPVATITRKGMAVFKKDKLVGFLKGKDAEGLLWALGEIRHSVVTIEVPEGKGTMSLHFHNAQVRIIPKLNHGHIEIDLTIRTTGSVSENESTYSSLAESHLRKIEQLTSKKIHDNIKETIDQLQHKYVSDAIGFGEAIYRKYPKRWEQLRDEWHDRYPNLKVNIHVITRIENSGTIVRPVAQEEGNIIGH